MDGWKEKRGERRRRTKEEEKERERRKWVGDEGQTRPVFESGATRVRGVGRFLWGQQGGAGVSGGSACGERRWGARTSNEKRTARDKKRYTGREGEKSRGEKRNG